KHFARLRCLLLKSLLPERLAIIDGKHGFFTAPVSAAGLADNQMVHDRKKPAAWAVAALPILHLPKRPFQRVLHKIVRRSLSAQQRPRISPQARYFGQDRGSFIVHEPVNPLPA